MFISLPKGLIFLPFYQIRQDEYIYSEMIEKILENGMNIIENAIVRMEKFATHMQTISVPNIV